MPTQCDQHTMPTVSSIDGSRWYRYRNHTRAIRSPSNSVSAWFIEKTHSRHVKKSQRSRLHARGEGRRGQWTSVKAIYVNAETRILIYILCGSEFAIVIPGKIRWATAPNQRHFLSSAVPERLSRCTMPVPRLRFEKRRGARRGRKGD